MTRENRAFLREEKGEKEEERKDEGELGAVRQTEKRVAQRVTILEGEEGREKVEG